MQMGMGGTMHKSYSRYVGKGGVYNRKVWPRCVWGAFEVLKMNKNKKKRGEEEKSGGKFVWLE